MLSRFGELDRIRQNYLIAEVYLRAVEWRREDAPEQISQTRTADTAIVTDRQVKARFDALTDKIDAETTAIERSMGRV